MRPNSRPGSVSATSTVILTCSPWLLVMVSGVRLNAGPAVRVASAPGIAVPARAVGGTHAVVAWTIEVKVAAGTGVRVGAGEETAGGWAAGWSTCVGVGGTPASQA